MKIYVVGSNKNKFLELDNIREKFLIDEKHEGDNIDFLNPWYCELTGLYYLWKHVDDEVVGLEHYRRYFVNDKGELLSENEINELLKENDVICAPYRRYRKNETIFSELCEKDENTLNLLKQYNNKSENKMDLYNEPYKHSFNMIIAKKDTFNKIVSTLFKYINNFIVENDLRKMNKRIIGYISEYYLSELVHDLKFKIMNVREIYK